MPNKNVKSYLVSYIWYTKDNCGVGNVILGMNGKFDKRLAEKHLTKMCKCLKVIVLNYVEREK